MATQEMEDDYRQYSLLREVVEDASFKATALPDTEMADSIRSRLRFLLEDIEQEWQQARNQVLAFDNSWAKF